MKLIVFILIFSHILAAYGQVDNFLADTPDKLREGDVDYLNGISVGMISSSMAACAGDNNDSKTIYTAGIILLMGEALDFEISKKLQEMSYKYKKDENKLANDSQKLAITGEGLKNISEVKGLLEQKERLQQGAISAFTIAESEAKQGLISMLNAKKSCYVDIYHSSEKPIPIYNDSTGKFMKWAYGQCEKDAGDWNYTGGTICKDYVAAKAAYKAASGKKGAAKILAKMLALKESCDYHSHNTGIGARMYVGTGKTCVKKCVQAGEEAYGCLQGIRTFKKYGFPTIETLSIKEDNSTKSSAEILLAHKASFINTYRACGRKKLLDELWAISSKGKTDDTNLLNLNLEAQRIGETVGGQGYSDINKAKVDKDRKTEDQHKTEGHQSNELITEIGTFNIDKKNIFKDYSFSPTKKGESTPTCADSLAKTCGGYSRLLMKSLNGCTQTLESTSYALFTKEVLESVADMLPKGIQINPKLLKNNAKWDGTIFISSANASYKPDAKSSMVNSIGSSLGIGGPNLDALNLIQKSMIKKLDPLLSTYDKRVIAYGVAAKIVKKMINNTKINIEDLERRIAGIKGMDKTMSSGKAGAKIEKEGTLPILHAAATAVENHPKLQSKFFKALKKNCRNKDCSFEVEPSPISDSAGSKFKKANDKITKGAIIVADISKTMQVEGRISNAIRSKIEDLGEKSKDYEKVSSFLGEYAENMMENKAKTSFAKEQDKILAELEMVKGMFAKTKKVKQNQLAQTDRSLYYEKLKKDKKKKEEVKDVAKENPIIDENYPDDYEYLAGDISQDKSKTLWSIISFRYAKIKERILSIID